MPGLEGWSVEGGWLRVGMMWHEGVVRPVKPTRRGLRTVVEGLRRRDDVEVVDFQARDVAEIWDNTVSVGPYPAVKVLLMSAKSKLYWTDGGRDMREALGEEPLFPLTEWVMSFAKDLSTDEVTKFGLFYFEELKIQ